MKSFWLVAVRALVATLAASAMRSTSAVPEPGDAFRGSLSRVPAGRWEDAFVTGNGRMGAMLFGSPGNETLVANHWRLFLPLGNREIVPDLARYLPELRRTIREKGYGEAMNFLLGKAKEQGFPGIIPTDPYHPALLVNIRQPVVGEITGYERREDFQTGEVTERWRDSRGEFVRRLFVSRADNLIALSITGPAACDLEFPAVENGLVESEQQTVPGWVMCHNSYRKGKGGFDAAVRILSRDRGRDVLLLIRIAPWKTPLPPEQSEAWAYSPKNPDFERPGRYQPAPPLADSSVVAYRTARDAAALLPEVKKALARVKGDYDSLFLPHARAHAALFNRVSLDLGGRAGRTVPTEDLLAEAARESRLPAALAEKCMMAAAICSFALPASSCRTCRASGPVPGARRGRVISRSTPTSRRPWLRPAARISPI